MTNELLGNYPIYLKYEISHLTELSQTFFETLNVLFGDDNESLFPSAQQFPFLDPHQTPVEVETGGGG